MYNYIVMYMTIERLKDIREDRNLTQKDIAKILDVPQQNYSRYELGIVKMPVDKYEVLADFYNVSIDYLIGRTDVSKPYSKSILK